MLVTAREVEVEFVIVPFVANKFPAVSAVEDAYGNVDATIAFEVIAPLLPIVVVAVPPIESCDPLNTFAKIVVPVALVQVIPPLKFNNVVVALPGNK